MFPANRPLPAPGGARLAAVVVVDGPDDLLSDLQHCLVEEKEIWWGLCGGRFMGALRPTV